MSDMPSEVQMMVSVAKANLKLRLIQFAVRRKIMKPPKFFNRSGKIAPDDQAVETLSFRGHQTSRLATPLCQLFATCHFSGSPLRGEPPI
jgi:hypothetical protein